MNAAKGELFTVTRSVSEYHYTLYYYDQAGNLVKTVPPSGVKANFNELWLDSVATARNSNQSKIPPHELATQYRYNSLNQVITQKSPDGGLSHFWYDRLGRLVISQNAKQRAASTDEEGRLYSYTTYDHLGRITEVGEIENAGSDSMDHTVSKNAADLSNWIDNSAINKSQITTTVYDIAYGGFTGISPTPMNQWNLRNRVSYSSITHENNPAQYNQATFYSYDIHGNVDTMVQDYGAPSGTRINIMNANDNRFKKFVYKYDLISGKVNMMQYQPKRTDQFIHRYTYDAENRLTLVETSADSVIWEREARYEYYHHGPLARVILGHQQVQGVDYAYTLQGWLKGVNSLALTSDIDMGRDGDTTYINRYIPQDEYGFSLNYFDGEYTPINTGKNPFPGVKSHLGSTNHRPLFNGNISSMGENIRMFNSSPFFGGGAVLYNYSYDQLNRIKTLRTFTGFNSSTNDWQSLTMSNKLRETFTYDANGNIQKLHRYGHLDGSPMLMDSLNYYYYPGTNQLRRVSDNAYYEWYSSIPDIDNQTEANNYQYDEIGNLIADASNKITNIKWTPYGKIAEMEFTSPGYYKVTKATYKYDAQGNRIYKVIERQGTTNKEYTFYVRDAQGNVIATLAATSVATNLSDIPIQQQERYIYGSSRLGAYQYPVNLGNGPGSYQGVVSYAGWRNARQYELTNHLGNVLVTLSDRKIGVPSTDSSLSLSYRADPVNATSYYAFGMMMPGRHFKSKSYRNWFNGKMNDDEEKGLGAQQDYGMRIYDPRLGRFLSVDPLTTQYPHYTPYSFAGNMPIQFIDIDGMEQGFDIRFKQMQRGYLKGTVTESELKGFYEANAQGAALGVGILLTRGAILRYGPSLFLWATNPANQQLIGTAGMVGVGLMDPNPSGAPTADLPGVGDDVGRLVKASTKKLFNSIKPILERRRDLAKAWGVAQKYIDFSKKVFTKDIEEGTELIQFRRKGAEGTVGDYFALPGTTPEQIGMNPNDITEALTIKVKNKTKVLFSTHKKNLPYYRDETIILQGGGLQIFSKDLKNNVEIIKKTPVNGVN